VAYFLGHLVDVGYESLSLKRTEVVNMNCHRPMQTLSYFPPPKWPILCRVGR